MNKRDDLSRALIATALDMPAVLDMPEISAVRVDDVAPALRIVWSHILDLHKENKVTLSGLVGSLPAEDHFDTFYFNTMRERYRANSVEDLAHIAYALRNHTWKAQLMGAASWLATESRNGRNAPDIARDLIEKITPIALSEDHDIQPLDETLDEIETEISERCKNPSSVWGIPYAWEHLSEITGGKQPGELTILAGEPGAGKSWMLIQDALHTAMQDVPVVLWSGEMKRKQVVRRMLQLMGMDGRRSRTGYMNDTDWDALRVGKEAIKGIPLFIEDRALTLADIRPMLTQYKTRKGVKQFILDYIMLVGAPGKDETEKTDMITGELKRICNSLEISIIAIASVTKAGMDSATAVKSAMRGSGQQIHDADNVLFLTKFNPEDNDQFCIDNHIKPDQYDRLASLHIKKARELDQNVKGGFINYERLNSPKFTELK